MPAEPSYSKFSAVKMAEFRISRLENEINFLIDRSDRQMRLLNQGT